MIRVKTVKPLDGYRLKLGFTDGSTKIVDLKSKLWGPVFEPLRDPTKFRRVRVAHGTITWPNGADLDPEVLCHGGTPPWAKKRLKIAR